jgi:hypothetical protein
MGVGRNLVPRFLLAAAAIAGLSMQAHAASVPVANPSFEAPVTGGFTDDGSDTIRNTTNAGWWGWGYFFANTSVDHDSGVQTNANAQISLTSDGNQGGWVNGAGNYLYQDVGALQPNTLYTLTVAVAAPGPNSYAGFGGTSGTPATNAETDVLALLNGNNVLAGSGKTNLTSTPVQATGIDSQGVATTSDILASQSVTPSAGGFSDDVLSFTTGASVSGDLTLILEETAAGAHEQGNFDNVHLTAVAVPEPTSAGLLCLGSLLALRRRRAR